MFFLEFCFWYVFGRFSVRGVQKHDKKIAKSPCRFFFPKNFSEIDKNFDSSFSSTFLFCCVFSCYLAMGVQKHYKKRFTKQIVSKSFSKTIDKKNPKPIFSRFFCHVFVVSREGS
jgi:hypothetical protein